MSLDKLNDSLLEVGETYTAHGSVAPAIGGLTVQVLADGVPVTQATTDSDGEYGAQFAFTEAGRQVKYSAYLQPSGANLESSTNAGEYDVYAWEYLSDIKPLSKSKNFSSEEQRELGGKTFERALAFTWSAASFGGWSSGNATFNLGARCRKVSALVGTDDNAKGDKTQWSFTFRAAGRSATSGYRGVFHPKRLEIDASNAPRLTVEASRKKGANEWSDYEPYEGDGVVADAQALCMPL